MIRLVIEIPEKDYNNIEPFLNGETIKGGFNLFKALEIIKNGKPLPKGHGRLIDADEYKEHLYACETNGRPLHIMELNERLATVDDTPTIIEADKESAE